jgi:hypothetical protein
VDAEATDDRAELVRQQVRPLRAAHNLDLLPRLERDAPGG